MMTRRRGKAHNRDTAVVVCTGGVPDADRRRHHAKPNKVTATNQY